MLKNIFTLFILTLPAYALRDFAAEYLQARQEILKACQSPAQNKKCKLTVLHRAVLRGDIDKIKSLVANGANLESQAKAYWTAAHFAALHEDRQILNLLYSLGASRDILNKDYGTPEHLWNLTHLTDSQKVNIWDENSNMVKEISSEDFTSLTGARFIESIKMSPAFLVKLWLNPSQFQTADPKLVAFLLAKSWAAQIQSAYQKGQFDQNKVYLKKSLSHSGYGLHAYQSFETGEIIGEYQGEWVGKPEKVDSEYSTEIINSKHLRGYVAFCSDGMPNAMLMDLGNRRGLPHAQTLVALRPIAPHEPILWSYGGHDVVWGKYVEQNAEELNEFIKSNGLKQTKDFGSIKALKNARILTYVLTTPSVFLRLFFEDRLSQSSLDVVIASQDMIRKDFQQSYQDFFSFIKKTNKKEVYQFMSAKAKEGNVQVLYVFMNNFQPGIDLDVLWFKSWIAFCDFFQNSEKFKEAPERGDCQTLRSIQGQIDHQDI